MPQFLHLVLSNPDEIYRSKTGRPMVVKRLDKSDGEVVVKLSETGDAYSVTTAFVERAGKIAKQNTLLWRRREPASSDTSATQGPQR